MEQKQTPPEEELTTKFPFLYVAFELGNSPWKGPVGVTEPHFVPSAPAAASSKACRRSQDRSPLIAYCT
jgi:hypothetical protein